MKTYITQDHYKNWSAKTTVMLNDTIELSIITRKNDASIQSSASCGKCERGFVSHVVYQDFYKVITRIACKRVTSKAIEAQHNTLNFDDIISEARTFYGISNAKQ